MTLRIFHVADLHLGARPPPSGLANTLRYRDVLTSMDRLCDYVLTRRPHVVTVSGDTLHADIAPGDAVATMQRFVGRMHAAGIRVIGICGNHDPSPDWLTVCGVHDVDAEPVVVNGVTIAGLASVHPAAFYDKLRVRVAAGPFDILLVHQAFSELCGFKGEHLTLADMAPVVHAAGCRLVLMGDIHNRGSMDVGGVYFVYPGSVLERLRLDEHEDKAMYEYEVEKTGAEPITFVEHVVAAGFHRKTLELRVYTEEEYTAFIATLATTPKDEASAPIIIVRYNGALQDSHARINGALSGYPLVRTFPEVLGEHEVLATGERLSARTAAEKAVERHGMVATLRDMLTEQGLVDAEGRASQEARLITVLLSADADTANRTLSDYVKHYAPTPTPGS